MGPAEPADSTQIAQQPNVDSYAVMASEEPTGGVQVAGEHFISGQEN